MKKKKLKRWVVNTLCVISLICLLLMSGETESLLNFIIIKVIALVIFTICSYLIIKYGG